MSPIAFARSAGLLDGPSLLAHVNYCSDDELAMLASGNASVVYCPRTHRHFDHPRHRWREMLDAGINVAIGTDSCASSPDLNLVEELRFLHRLAPEVDSLTIWQLATTRAAIAIQQPRAGSLSPGQFADFAVFPALAGSDPLKALLESEARASALWINGRPVSIDE
jgi:cytosine/adenosine deaminase-related metal-dependent hydrolase